MREMGTHLCALPTGDPLLPGPRMPRLGPRPTQTIRALVFCPMPASHTRALDRAKENGEPDGQRLGACQLEMDRIRSALRRAEEFDDDVAVAIEASAG